MPPKITPDTVHLLLLRSNKRHCQERGAIKGTVKERKMMNMSRKGKDKEAVSYKRHRETQMERKRPARFTESPPANLQVRHLNTRHYHCNLASPGPLIAS